MVKLNLVNESQARLTRKIGVDSTDLHQFLRFRLQPNFTAAIEIDAREAKLHVGAASPLVIRVTEIINISIDVVVPMPHLPPAVMGVYNWRGKILWIVDLAMLLGLTDRIADRHHRHLQPTIVITSAATTGSEAQTIGFVVDEISDIEWCRSDLMIEPIADQFHLEQSQWVRGYAISATGEKLAILDGQAMIECANLHADI
jgi:positive phototaxis protein PixI